MAQYPLVNNNAYDFSSIEITISKIGRVSIGVQAISYKNALKPGVVRGTSSQKNGRTRGQYDPTASMTMYKADADELIDELGDGYMEVPFDITVNFAEDGMPMATTELIGCRLIDDGEDMKEGGEAVMVKFDLDVMMILKNTHAPIKNARY